MNHKRVINVIEGEGRRASSMEMARDYPCRGIKTKGSALVYIIKKHVFCLSVIQHFTLFLEKYYN